MVEKYNIALDDLKTKFVSKLDIYNRLTLDRKRLSKCVYSTIFSFFDEKMSFAFHKGILAGKKEVKIGYLMKCYRFTKYTQ